MMDVSRSNAPGSFGRHFTNHGSPTQVMANPDSGMARLSKSNPFIHTPIFIFHALILKFRALNFIAQYNSVFLNEP